MENLNFSSFLGVAHGDVTTPFLIVLVGGVSLAPGASPACGAKRNARVHSRPTVILA